MKKTTRLEKFGIITADSPLQCINDSTKWRFWPIGSAARLVLETDIKTTVHSGARIVIYPVSIRIDKPVIPRLYLAIDTFGMWQLINETKEKKRVIPLDISYKAKLSISLIFEKDAAYVSLQKNKGKQQILKDFYLGENVHAAFLLPPNSGSTMTISKLTVFGNSLSIDRRII